MAHYPPQAPQQETRDQSRESPAQRNTTLLWTLVTLTTLLLVCLVAGALAATGGQLPDLSPGPLWTPPPSPSITANQSPGLAPGLFAPGDLVSNVSGSAVNLRRAPGYLSKPVDDVITVVEAGGSGLILDGPVLADGLTWWRVQFAEWDGWMAERTNGGVLLLAPSP